MWCVLWFGILVSVCFNCCSCHGNDNNIEEQLKVLSKQVTTLLDMRRDDIRIIEESMKKKLLRSQEFVELKDQLKILRLDIEQNLRPGHNSQPHVQHNNQQKNDHLTIKWLSNAISELKNELSEIQVALNTTILLENKEQTVSEISLLHTDIKNMNKELEKEKNKNTHHDAVINELRDEIKSLRDSVRASFVMNGKLKNQLQISQHEWSSLRKNLQKRDGLDEIETEKHGREHTTRHQRILRKHISELIKSTQGLETTNKELKDKIITLENEIRDLKMNNFMKDRTNNDIMENTLLRDDEMTLPEKISKLENAQKINTLTIHNLTEQITNYDKLHMSMLELLENVESIENKVDESLPDFRKEISKLEFQLAQTETKVSAMKEDQKNTRDSVKAISVSVSNLVDKFDEKVKNIEDFEKTLDQVKESSNIQTAKLHDHILKSESALVDYNSTKSTLHLVQELKSFETEYKSIVNKLPHDCSFVESKNGIYLIAPGDGEPIMASCQDGWTVIQRRMDGSVDFNKKWNEYSAGFGSPTGEHWLGNKNIHSITRDNCTELQINMKDIYGKYWQANYDSFHVGDLTTGYKLTVSGFTGNSSDALDYQNNMEFSTVDNDRDISNTHCASNYEGGWWFSHCQHANLNGRYNLGLTWFDKTRNEWIAVATAEMRVKRKIDCQ